MIHFDDGALSDLERIFGFNLERDAEWAERQIESIRTAVMILEQHPHIGRPVPSSALRELVISVGKTGFIALYQYEELDDLVRILGIRHQLEAGYRDR
ncbi:MAG: type II toxin-antitoxin system RelE/ParE family toxin [Archangium sp.]|nr:type II toxin-antitoxin system RelE/ParE family toxin [Archangium sp.]